MQPRYISVATSLCLLLILLFVHLPQEMQPLTLAIPGQATVIAQHTDIRVASNIVKRVPQSELKDESNTNITRAQFEEARAKWQAGGVQEYEIIVYFEAMIGGSWKLRVRNEGSKPIITRVRWVNEDGTEELSPYKLTPDYVRYLTSFTVESTFAKVELVLNEDSPRNADRSFYYEVKFDPRWGYVTYLLSAELPRDNHPPPTDSATLLTVKGLRIIKSNMPGMPKSGNPGP
jgi:hypothetical protein